MKNILHIITSPRGAQSYSIQLGTALTEKLAAANPGSNVTELNLADNPYDHISGDMISAFFTPHEQLNDNQKTIIQPSNDAVQQLLDTDILVIGLPLYNLGIPSNLKSWLDNVVRAGKTFAYSAEGPKGLVEGKTVYIAVASGGVYSEGPFKAFDFIEPYLRGTLGFIGITDVHFVRAEGTSRPELQENAVSKALDAVAV